MKIFIDGGSGSVAAVVIQKLKKQGHAYAETMKKQLEGMDAVYFLAGSRGKDLLQTDAFGAVKLMQAN